MKKKELTTSKRASAANAAEPTARLRSAPRANVSNALLVHAFCQQTYGELDLKSVVVDLMAQCDSVHGGDLARVEAMLTAQAHSLDAIFTTLAMRAARAEFQPQLEINLRLGLKAQAQCRATLETLAAIKNPPVFAKQANIAHGPQQVNNGTPATHAQQSESAPTELLEHDHGKWVDSAKTIDAGRRDQKMEAVVAVHRPTQCRGKIDRKP